jgi:hypothetical protein
MRRRKMQISENQEPKWWREYDWKKSILRWVLGIVFLILPILLIIELAAVMFLGPVFLIQCVLQADWEFEEAITDMWEWDVKHFGPSRKSSKKWGD